MSVYVSKERGQCIVCPMVTPAPGLYFEAAAPAVLPFGSNRDVLGRATWDALLAFRQSEEISLKTTTDWPAFRVSGVKWVGEFRRAFVSVLVEALPDALQIEAMIPSKRAKGLFVGRSLSTVCEFEEIGNTLHECSWCALILKEKEYRY